MSEEKQPSAFELLLANSDLILLMPPNSPNPPQEPTATHTGSSDAQAVHRET
jgi:hypothetical protein